MRLLAGFLAFVLSACGAFVQPDQEWGNVEAGDGWRLIAAQRVDGPDKAYRVDAANTRRELERLWREIGHHRALPDVDFEREVAVAFAHGIGSSCPELRLDAVVIQGGVVFSSVSDPIVDRFGSPRACTADLVGAVTFVVAVERAALPDDGFTLRLTERSVTCDDCGFSEEIRVDLP